MSNEEMIYSQNKIEYPDKATLIVSDFENHEGEIIDGWYWFNTRADALLFFNIQEPQI